MRIWQFSLYIYLKRDEIIISKIVRYYPKHIDKWRNTVREISGFKRK